MSLRKVLHPTPQDHIEGYERLIARMEKQIAEYRARILELKGQETLTTVCRR